MTYADIIIMLKAGYTKEEIEAMDQPEQAAPEAQPETQPADPAPEAPAEEQAPEAQPEAPAAPAEAPADPTQKILQQLTELVRSVQAQNRGAAEIRGNIIEPGAQAMDTLRSLGDIPAAPENK
jgi:hypothetical protein